MSGSYDTQSCNTKNKWYLVFFLKIKKLGIFIYIFGELWSDKLFLKICSLNTNPYTLHFHQTFHPHTTTRNSVLKLGKFYKKWCFQITVNLPEVLFPNSVSLQERVTMLLYCLLKSLCQDMQICTCEVYLCMCIVYIRARSDCTLAQRSVKH